MTAPGTEFVLSLGIADPKFIEAMQAGFPDSEEPEVTVIVTGAPRSGTSMLAGLLYHSGFHLGSRCIGPRDHNTKGLYEDELIVKLNSHMLAAASGFWLYPPAPEQLALVNLHRIIDNLVKYEGRRYWGWKDGRFALTLPLWWPSLAGLEPRLVVCERNVEATAQSIKRWWPMPLEQAVSLVLTYRMRIAEHIDKMGINAATFVYDDFIKDPQGEAARLAEFLGVDIPPALASEWVDSDLKHF